MKKVMGCFGIAFAVVLLVHSWRSNADQAAQRQRDAQAQRQATQQKEKDSQTFARLSNAEHLSIVKNLLTGDAGQISVELGFRHLDALPKGSPEALQGEQVRRRYEILRRQQEQRQAREKASHDIQAAKARELMESSMRVGLAKTFENQMLDGGYNMDVTAEGPRHTVLRIKWILADKVLVRALSKKGEMFSNARDAGFKSVVLTDGYDETWTWKLD
jgi:hypothetical protein